MTFNDLKRSSLPTATSIMSGMQGSWVKKQDWLRASRQPILAHFSTAEESRILQTVERKVQLDFINGLKVTQRDVRGRGQ